MMPPVLKTAQVTCSGDSHTMAGKQQQCVSDIWELAPANNFSIRSNMGLIPVQVTWCLK